MKFIETPESSNVKCIGYENGIIEVHFNNGYVYQYPDCSEDLFNSFLTAPSKGEFVHQVLKPRPIVHRIR